MSLSVEQRLARIERQNRRLWAVLAVSTAVVSVVMVAGFGRREPAPKSLQAQAFELVDAAGTRRGTFAMGRSGPEFRLDGADGTPRFAIICDDAKGRTAWCIMDENHKIRATMASMKPATVLCLANGDEKARITIQEADDKAAVLLHDTGERVRLRLGQSALGTAVILRDKNNDLRTYMAEDGDNCVVGVLSPGEQVRAELAVMGKDALAAVADADENIMWQAPQPGQPGGKLAPVAKPPSEPRARPSGATLDPGDGRVHLGPR